MSNLGWNSNSGGGSGGYTHPSSHPASMITVQDIADNFTSTTVEDVLTELFQSGNSGKNNIETAVISKGGVVSKAGSVATFAELTSAITSLPSGNKKATGTITTDQYGDTNQNVWNGSAWVLSSSDFMTVTGLTFKPNIIFGFLDGTNDVNIVSYCDNMLVNSYKVSVVSNATTVKMFRLTDRFYVNETGFTLPAITKGTYTWFAFE